MALDVIRAAETINLLENFIDKRRPPEHIRSKVDLSYKIENQSVIIFEIRPHWRNENEMIEQPIAKTTWVNTQKIWKIYWMRADLKWHSYEPKAIVKKIEQFLKTVDEDAHGCFWG
jgi:hypothetical protein